MDFEFLESEAYRELLHEATLIVGADNLEYEFSASSDLPACEREISEELRDFFQESGLDEGVVEIKLVPEAQTIADSARGIEVVGEQRPSIIGSITGFSIFGFPQGVVLGALGFASKVVGCIDVEEVALGEDEPRISQIPLSNILSMSRTGGSVLEVINRVDEVLADRMIGDCILDAIDEEAECQQEETAQELDDLEFLIGLEQRDTSYADYALEWWKVSGLEGKEVVMQLDEGDTLLALQTNEILAPKSRRFKALLNDMYVDEEGRMGFVLGIQEGLDDEESSVFVALENVQYCELLHPRDENTELQSEPFTGLLDEFAKRKRIGGDTVDIARQLYKDFSEYYEMNGLPRIAFRTICEVAGHEMGVGEEMVFGKIAIDTSRVYEMEVIGFSIAVVEQTEEPVLAFRMMTNDISSGLMPDDKIHIPVELITAAKLK